MDRSEKIITISPEKCDLCGTCVGVCPENVMHLSWNALHIDHNGCTRCSKCVWICPVSALKLENTPTQVRQKILSG